MAWTTSLRDQDHEAEGGWAAGAPLAEGCSHS